MVSRKVCSYPCIPSGMIQYPTRHVRAQADQWKLYPCETLPWTVIKKWYDEGSYVPYSEEELVRVLIAEGAPRATRAGIQARAPLSCTRARERAREQGAGMGLRAPHMHRRAPHLHAGTLLSRLCTVSGRGRFRLANRRRNGARGLTGRRRSLRCCAALCA
jgi:hypothetical protein